MNNGINSCRYRVSRILIYFFALFGVIFSITANGQPPKKVKIFLMAGQSNTEGHGPIPWLERLLCAKGEIALPDDVNACYDSIPEVEERLRQTLEDFYRSYGNYNDPQARYQANFIAQSKFVDERLLEPFDQVQVANFRYTGFPKRATSGSVGALQVGHGVADWAYGPELVFGHYLAQYLDEDIILIKVAQGGTTLHQDWRSPSAEARLGVSPTGSNYPRLKQRVTQVINNLGGFFPKYQGQQVETELAGFVWFQGFNDASSLDFARMYEQNLTDLVNDVRNEFNLPGLPVVIGKSHRDFEAGFIIQEAQQSVADNMDNTRAVETTDLSANAHFNPASYLVIGERMGEQMVDLLNLSHPVLPGGWNSADVGAPLLPGSASYYQRLFTLQSSGAQINASADEFHYAYQSLTGDGEIIARIPALSQNIPSVKGLMIRENLTPGSKHVMIASDGPGITFKHRAQTGQATNEFTIATDAQWLRLRKLGNTFKGYISQDGTVWEEVAEQEVAMSNAVNIGLAATGQNETQLTHATFSDVCLNKGISIPAAVLGFTAVAQSPISVALNWTDTLRNEDGFRIERSISSNTGFEEIGDLGRNTSSFTDLKAEPQQTYYYRVIAYNEYGDSKNNQVVNVQTGQLGAGLPSPWMSTDIGTLPSPGSAFYDIDDNSFTIRSAGKGVSGTSDQFHFIFQSLPGDGEIVTKIKEMDDTGFMAATGLMIRQGLGAHARFVMCAINSSANVIFSERTSVNGSVSVDNYASQQGYRWLRLVRGNGKLTGYVSLDGFSWKRISSSPDFPGDVEIGLATYDTEPSSSYTSIFGHIAVNDGAFLPLPVTSINTEKSLQGVSLSWGNAPTNEVGFKVSRSQLGGPFVEIANVSANTTTYLDSIFPLNGNRNYFYRIDAYNDAGTTIGSESKRVPTNNMLPAAPSGFKAQPQSPTSIKLSWEDRSGNEQGFWVERLNPMAGFERIAELGANTTSFEDTTLIPLTTYHYRIKSFNRYGHGLVQASARTMGLSDAWQNYNVGSPALDGAFTVVNDTFSVQGGGDAIKGRSDEFNFVYKELAGDGEIIAKVDSISQTAGIPLAGVMIRGSLVQNAAFGMMTIRSNSRTLYRDRRTSGTSTFQRVSTGPVADRWVRIVKKGNTMNAYTSGNGVDWQHIVERKVMIGANSYIGLVVNSNDVSALSTAVFSHVTVRSVLDSLVNEVPLAPTGLAAEATSTSSVQLTWTDASNNETAFKVMRSISAEAGFLELASLPAGATFFEDTHLQPNTTYYYRVLAHNSSGISAHVTVAVQTLSFVLLTPTGLTAEAGSANSVQLNWTDNSDNETGFKVERSTSPGTGFVEIATLGANSTSYEDTGLQPVNTYYYRVVATNGAGVSGYSEVASTQTNDPVAGMPSPWKHGDIGNVTLAGGATYSKGTFTIEAGGADIWGRSDEFHFVYQSLIGDGQVIARVESLGNTDNWAKAGVMIRETLAHNSRHAMMIITPMGTTAFQRRTATGALSVSTAGTPSVEWVKLERSGDLVTAYTSAGGTHWQVVGTETLAMGTDAYIGLAVTSHNAQNLTEAVISEVNVVHAEVPATSARWAVDDHKRTQDPNDALFLESQFQANNALKVYPTKNNGHLVIESIAAYPEAIKVNLFNAHGQSIPLQLSQHENKIEIRFEGAPGMYLMHMMSPQFEKSIRLIKE